MLIGFTAGSFDPPTFGHLAFLEKAISLCDKLYIGVGINPQKKVLFSPEERVTMIETLLPSEKIEAFPFEGLAVEKAKEVSAAFLLRSLRNSIDFVKEKEMAYANKKMSGLETIFLLAEEKWQNISSTLVKEIFYNQGDLSHFIPQSILPFLKKKSL